ncbi:MAG: hypothetical protein NUV31_00730 [Dehalococcoidales bacterium]|nr:hypothetical protein [Dehalococcoidales bacterium]
MKKRLLPLILLLVPTILCLMVLSPHLAVADSLKWSEVDIPAQGQSGGWVLAEGSDIQVLTRGPDGTLYCSANPSGTSYRLFKSIDEGKSWVPIGRVTDVIRDIVVVPDHPGLIYYASISKVFRSSDGGNTFSPVVQYPGDAGANGIEITSLDITTYGGEGNHILIGTQDSDAARYGGVYLLDENDPFSLHDLGVGDFDVLDVVFSPSYTDDQRILAVVVDGNGTRIRENILEGGWGNTIGDALINGVNAISASLILPEDYAAYDFQEGSEFFVALSTGTGEGDVYLINERQVPSSSSVVDLGVGSAYGMESLDVTSLVISGIAGERTMLAGTAGAEKIYFSLDGGMHWSTTNKPPTGDKVTSLILNTACSVDTPIYAATAGDDSAVSVSYDKGLTWEQISLVDTRILDIIDVAVPSDFESESAIFLLTGDVERSLWRSMDGGGSWSRIFSTRLRHVDRLDMVLLSSSYSRNHEFYLSGISDGKPAVWKFKNNGQNFLRLFSRDPVTGSPAQIDCWAIAPDDALFTGSFDGNRGYLYQLAPGRTFYSRRTPVGYLSLNSIALSPDYPADRNILVGNTGGGIYLSQDDGYTFEPLPENSAFTSPPGSISAVFDDGYSRNRTIFASSNVAGKGVYSFIIGKSSVWSWIDPEMPEGRRIHQLVVSPGGQLYADNLQPVDLEEETGGMERCLDPSGSGNKFETVISGLSSGMILKKIRVSGNSLWGIEATGGRLFTFKDTAINSVELLSPTNGSPGMETRHINISWRPVEGVKGYLWQINTNENFSDVPENWQGTSQSTSVNLPSLEPDSIYFWRVRPESPVEGPWSDKWSFSTLLTTELQAPKLTAPTAAAENVPLKPVFQWSAFAGAERYEIMVAADNSFTSPVVSRTGIDAIPSTAWKSDVSLEYGRTYYWKVRAVSSASFSAWSPVNAFTTVLEEPPVATVTVTQLPAVLPGSDPTSPAVMAISPSATPETTSDQTISMIYLLLGILMALLVVLAIVVIYLVRLFKRRYP